MKSNYLVHVDVVVVIHYMDEPTQITIYSFINLVYIGIYKIQNYILTRYVQGISTLAVSGGIF